MRNYCVRLDDEVIALVEKLYEGTSISEKLRECVSSRLFELNDLVTRKKEHRRRINEIDEMLKNNILSGKFPMSKQEKAFLKETAKKLKDPKNQHMWFGRYDLYKNKFNRKLTYNDFRHLVTKNESG